jgi:hypothetical protein
MREESMAMVVDIIDSSTGVVAEEADVLAEARLEFPETRDRWEMSADCQCISNETCCGCMIQ